LAAVALLDVNLLVALAWPNHVHHLLAHQWFAQQAENGWATSPITQAGFVRISSNPRVIADAYTPREALIALRRIVAHPHHVFWPDDESLATSPHFDAMQFVGFRQVTDAHLVALALSHSGALATLDRGIPDLLPAAYTGLDGVILVSPSPD
jgi:toxin-antitoxin system PIN domain toxin